MILAMLYNNAAALFASHPKGCASQALRNSNHFSNSSSSSRVSFRIAGVISGTFQKGRTAGRMASAAVVPSSDAPTSEDVSSKAHIFEPTTREGTDALLLFLPGAFVAPREYFPLIQAVQSRCGFRLWIAVLDPGDGNAVMTPMVDASFEGVLRRVKERGFTPGELPSSNVFVGGHSWGAWSSRTVAVRKADGFIQIGSCFHGNPDNLAQYPKPVLTLAGERDGQITLAAIAKHAGEIVGTKAELGDYNMHAIKPVIIIPGMNHAQTCHGIPNKQRGDLDADIPLEEARDVSADAISAFLTVHVCGIEQTEVTQALASLTKAVTRTQEQYRTFWEALDRQGKEGKRLQVELAALPGLTEENVGVVEHDFLDNFLYSKPSIDSNAQRIIINTYLCAVGSYGVVKNFWIKMKSLEAVTTALGNGQASSGQQDLFSIGADFNAKAYALALDLVPAAAKKKYYEHGKKLRFVNDYIVRTSAEDWINSDLIVKPADDGSGFVDVQSPVVITPIQGISSRFAGMHYLKLLTAARAMHWILMDCYR